MNVEGLLLQREGCGERAYADPPIDVNALARSLSFIPDSIGSDVDADGILYWESVSESLVPYGSSATIWVDLNHGIFALSGGRPVCSNPMTGEFDVCGPPTGNGVVDDPMADFGHYLPMLGIEATQVRASRSDLSWEPSYEGDNILARRFVHGVPVGEEMNFEYADDTGLTAISGRWSPVDHSRTQLAVEEDLEQLALRVADEIEERSAGVPVASITLGYEPLADELDDDPRDHLDMELWIFLEGGRLLRLDV